MALPVSYNEYNYYYYYYYYKLQWMSFVIHTVCSSSTTKEQQQANDKIIKGTNNPLPITSIIAWYAFMNYNRGANLSGSTDNNTREISNWWHLHYTTEKGKENYHHNWW